VQVQAVTKPTANETAERRTVIQNGRQAVQKRGSGKCGNGNETKRQNGRQTAAGRQAGKKSAGNATAGRTAGNPVTGSESIQVHCRTVIQAVNATAVTAEVRQAVHRGAAG